MLSRDERKAALTDIRQQAIQGIVAAGNYYTPTIMTTDNTLATAMNVGTGAVTNLGAGGNGGAGMTSTFNAASVVDTA